MTAQAHTTRGKPTTTRSAATKRRKARAELLRAAERYNALDALDDADSYDGGAVCDLISTATDKLVAAALKYADSVSK